jgi:hypothetical protein
MADVEASIMGESGAGADGSGCASGMAHNKLPRKLVGVIMDILGWIVSAFALSM